MFKKICSYSLMSEEEKKILYKFFFNYHHPITVLEVGTFLGGSAAIIASAGKHITVHSIDNYIENHDFHKPKVKNLVDTALKGKSRNKESISFLLKRFSNIKLYQGKSPEDFSFWVDPIDVYFEDSDHKNPCLEKNITFWTKFLKNDGVLILHDHRPFLLKENPHRFEDVIDSVEKLINSKKFIKIQQVDSLVFLKKI